jgi:hypothetical protein
MRVPVSIKENNIRLPEIPTTLGSGIINNSLKEMSFRDLTESLPKRRRLDAIPAWVARIEIGLSLRWMGMASDERDHGTFAVCMLDKSPQGRGDCISELFT